MEDKTFPKTSSLTVGGQHDLVGVEEFEGKVEAALAARRHTDFLVIARTEALIAGLGEQEALHRATRYARAGADLVFVHSKSKDPAEIESFVARWEAGTPLVLVPTAFPEMHEGRIRASGKVGMVIYGNHGIRASVAAMQAAFRQVAADGGIHGVQDTIASVEEIFRVQRTNELGKLVVPFLRGGLPCLRGVTSSSIRKTRMPIALSFEMSSLFPQSMPVTGG
jgi:phosphoenolpyruvate phosphomutase